MSDDVMLFSDEVRRRERARRRKEPLWGLLSFLLHAVVFAAIVLLTPVKELILPEEQQKEPMVISADRIESMAEVLEEARVQELLKQIADLQSVLHNMDVMKEQLAKDYDALAEQSVEDVHTQLEKLIDETAKQQQQAVEAQAVVNEEAREIVRVETTADLTNRETAQDLYKKSDTLKEVTAEKTATAQANAANALDKMQVKAEFAGYQKTAEAAELLREAQAEIAKVEDRSVAEAYETARTIASIAERDRRVKEYDKWKSDAVKQFEDRKNAIAAQKERQAKAEQDKVEAEKKAVEEQAAMAAAEKKVEELKAEKKFNEAKAAQKEVAQHKQARDRANRWAADVQRQANNARDAIQREEKRQEDNLRHQEKLAREQDKIKQELAKAREAEKRVQEPMKKLEEAKAAQEELNRRIEVLKATLAADTAQREKLSQGNEREENKLVDVQAPENLVKAFDLAKELESAITESYKDIKATQTAITKQMSIKAAEKLTDVAKPERLVADAAALEAKPRTKEEFDRQKKAQVAVIQEADVMVEATVAMMNEAMEIVMAGQKNAPELRNKEKPNEVQRLDENAFAQNAEAQAERLAAMKKESDFQLELESAAAEDSTQKAKDLAELMAKQDEAEKPQDKEGSPEKGDEGSSIGMMAGPPPLKGGELDLIPGNVMDLSGSAKNALPAKWMYISSWYVIGPFPNPNRMNLRRKFAPESVQDLDATYVGKDGRVLKWRFWQANNVDRPIPWDRKNTFKDAAQVMPENAEEYSIYYAYAEVFMDRDCDRWVAIGSDDRSDAWVNDLPIWGSSNKLKSWSLAEDYRRVHFKKGRNKVLVRIENGWHGMGWSFCISVDDAKSALQ